MSQQDDNQVPNGATEFIPRDQNEGTQPPARTDEVLPDTLQLIPLTSRPYFPVLIQPIVVDQDPWAEGIKTVAASAHKLVALNFAVPGEAETPRPEDCKDIGVVSRILRVHQSKDKLQFIAQGLRRVRIREWIRTTPPYVVRVDYPEETADAGDDQLRAYAMSLISSIKELMSLNPLYSEELKQYLNHFSPNDPSPLTDFAAAITSADPDELQDVLETLPDRKSVV